MLLIMQAADHICSILPANPSPIVLCNQRSLVNVPVYNESLKSLSSLNAKEDIETPGNFRCFDRMVSLCQRLLSAIIVEDPEETNRKLDYGPRGDCLHCTSEDSTRGNCTQIESDTGNTYDIQSQELDLDLDQRIVLELQSIGLFQELVPDLEHRGDEEIKTEICKLKNELQQQGLQGTNAFGCKIARNKVTKQAAQGFVEGKLAECRMFEETGKSCFSDASLTERMFSTSSKDKNKNLLGDAVKGDPTNLLADNAHALSHIKTSANPIVPSEQSAHIVAQHTQKLENGDWELCNTRQGTASYPVQTVMKDEAWSTPLKKRELLLEEVNSSGILRGTAAVGTTLPRGAKRICTKRDREGKVQAKEIVIRSGSTRSGRPDLANRKGEMKNKLKPRQKTAWLSAAENDLPGKPSKPQKPSLASSYWEKSRDKMAKVKDEMPTLQNSIADDDTSHDNIPIDLIHLQLPNLEDIASWLNYEDDSLPDADGDYMGLAEPKDDIADLNMF